MINYTIHPYSAELAPFFKSINEEWLRKDFTIEPIDEKVLGSPEEYIIKPGGHILFLKAGDTVAGTVALKPHDGGNYEITKMGVIDSFKGNGFGKKLMYEAISLGQKLGAEKVVLYSSRKLVPAISLYRSLGFTEIPVEAGKYERCDIQMEYEFDPLVNTFELFNLLDNFSKAYETIKNVLEKFPADSLKYRPAPGKWSIHEIISHLVDTETICYIRFRQFLTQPGELLVPFDQDQWCTTLNYHQNDIWKDLELFKQLRRKNYELLSRVPAKLWNNKALHAKRGEVTMLEWLRIYNQHTHIDQMERNFEHYKIQPGEIHR